MLRLKNLYRELSKALPDVELDYPALKLEYNKKTNSWKPENPGEHNVFAFIIDPLIILHLESGKNAGFLERVFNFIERMARSEDDSIVNIVAVTICPLLGDDKKILEKARKYMGERTLYWSHEAEKFWGRE